MAIAAERSGKSIGPVELALPTHFHWLQDWLNDALNNLADFASLSTTNHVLDKSLAALEGLVLNLVQMRADLAATTMLRPNLMEHAMLSETVERLMSLIKLYVGAIQAPTPLEAQKLASAAQRELDAVTDHLDLYSDRLETFTPFLDSTSIGGLMAASLRTTLTDWQCESPLELHETSERALNQLIAATAPDGIALEYATARTMASLTMDVDRFDDTVRSMYRLLLSNPETLERLAVDSLFVSDVQNRLNDFREALYSAHVVLANSASSSAGARQIVQLVGAVYEGAGHLVMNTWALASGTRTRTYAKLRHDNASDIHAALMNSAGIGSLLDGLDAHVRLAWAHSKVVYNTDSAIFETRSRGSKEVPYAEVFDTAFALIELVAASFIAIRCALGGVGVTFEDWDPFSDGLSSAGRLEMGAEIWAAPGTTVTVEMTTTDAIVSFGGRVIAEPRTVAGTLAGSVDPEHCATLSVRFQDPETIFAMDVLRYRRWKEETDDDHRSMLYVAMCRNSTQDGQPLVTRAQGRVWAARAAGAELSENVPASIKAIRRFRTASTVFEDPLIATVFNGSIRYLRESMLGEAADDTHWKTFQSWVNA